MQQIPETGGGLAGFIAWLLWQVYQYFPFEGTWDWLLLIAFLAVLTRCVMVPVWWRLVIAGVKPGEDPQQVRKEDPYHVRAILMLGDAFWPWLVIWLFNTAAGRTLLEGRSGQPLEVAQTLYWLSLVYHVTALVSTAAALGSWERFVFKHDFCHDFCGTTVTLILVHATVVLLAYLFYWHWSVASVTVFAIFSLSTIITSTTAAVCAPLKLRG